MPKVLIVDDSVAVRRMLSQVFHAEPDFEVCGEARDGREAIEKAQALQPDLIVMDLIMPVMNGLQAASAIKTLMPHVAIVMFSEYADAFKEQEAQSAGISALFSKSQDVTALVAKARSLLFGKGGAS